MCPYHFTIEKDFGEHFNVFHKFPDTANDFLKSSFYIYFTYVYMYVYFYVNMYGVALLQPAQGA